MATKLTGDYDSTKAKTLAYPISFFNVMRFDTPHTLKQAVLWAKKLYDTVGIIKQTIRKLAVYPVTSLHVANDVNGFYENLFVKQLKIKSFCQKVGMDYFTYGMAFITPMIPFTRYLVCPDCKNENLYGSVKKLRYNSNAFYGICSKCKHNVRFKVKDVKSKNPKEFKLKRWYPGSIQVIENELSGDYRIMYQLSTKSIARIRSGDVWYLKTTPLEFIQAVQKRTNKVELKPKMVYIMSIPEPSDPDSEIIGQPYVSGSWSDAFILKVLKKAQETMAGDRAVSYRVLYPEHSTENPLRMMDLRMFRSNVKTMLNRFYQNPNEMGISPVPIGQLHIGGDLKVYNPAPEIDAQKKDLLADLGVPLEFIYGGLSYSGSSISLRMLENIMLNYRESLTDMINFVANVVSVAFDKEAPGTIGFTEFKMADDVQRKSMLGQLNAQGKLSDKRLLDEYGMDSSEEVQEMLREVEANSELNTARAVASAKANAAASKEMALRQVTTQKLTTQASGGSPAMDMVRSGYIGMSVDAIAKALMTMGPAERSSTLSKINQQDPVMHQQILNKMYPPADMTSLPEQKPPTRGPDKGVV